MSISAVCACGARIEAPDDLAGRSVKCPQCSAAVSVPSSGGPGKGPARAGNYQEDGQIPADLKEKALAELSPNERLVWVGQPVPALVFRRNLGYLVGGALVALIGLFWLAGSFLPAAGGKAAGRSQATKAPPAAQSVNWVPIILLVGGAGCALLPLYHWKTAQRTCYALTNRRALVYKEGLFGPDRESYQPSEVSAMRRRAAWLLAGGGDLIFRTVTTVSRTSYGRGRSGVSVRTTHYGFLAIAEVRRVERLVRETLIDPFLDKLAAANAL